MYLEFARLIRQHDDKIQMRNIPLYLGATAGSPPTFNSSNST